MRTIKSQVGRLRGIECGDATLASPWLDLLVERLNSCSKERLFPVELCRDGGGARNPLLCRSDPTCDFERDLPNVTKGELPDDGTATLLELSVFRSNTRLDLRWGDILDESLDASEVVSLESSWETLIGLRDGILKFEKLYKDKREKIS